MNRTLHSRLMTLSAFTLGVLSLTACGGGGGGSSSSSGSPSTNSAAQIRGTAATGLAVVGTVSVVDANGLQRTVSTDSNGDFTLDVSSMTAPFMLKVEGSSGSRSVRLFSIATSSDINGIVNITSLTDVIAANVVQQDPSVAFDAANLSRVTSANVNSEKRILNLKIRSVIEALGLSNDSYDPISNRIVVQNSKEDFILDLIKSSFDPGTNSFTITNAVDGQSFQDDIYQSAETETENGIDDLQPNEAFMTSFSDFNSLRDRLAQFNTLLSSNALNPEEKASQLSTFISPAFQNAGFSFNSMSNSLSMGSYRITDLELAGRQTLNLAGSEVTILRVHANLRDSSNRIQRRLDDQYFIRGGNFGPEFIWFGNTRPFDMSVEFASRRLATANSDSPYSICYESGLQVTIKDPSRGQLFPSITYIDVAGPGLNTPVRFVRSQDSAWQAIGPGQSDGFIALTSTCTENEDELSVRDQNIKNIRSNAVYTLRPYDFQSSPVSTPNEIDDWTVHAHARRPMISSEAAESTAYINVTDVDSVFSNLTNGNSFTSLVSGDGANDQFVSQFYTQLTYVVNDAPYLMYQHSDVPTQNGSFMFGVDLNGFESPLENPLAARQLTATTFNSQGHTMISSWVRSNLGAFFPSAPSTP